MDDYIKREDAVKRIAVLIAAEAESDGYEDQPMENYIEYASEDLADVPSADVAPVRHAHWIKISPAGIYECSECGKNVMTSDIKAYEYCHGCGAKMDEGESDGTDDR